LQGLGAIGKLRVVDKNKTGARVLARAAAKVGGARALAQHLGISPGVLSRYVTGSAAVPDSIFLRAVDIILDELAPRPGAPAVLRTPLDEA
jgi:DNA-binding transcriptional regulator YdaS (Cro superfamily)